MQAAKGTGIEEPGSGECGREDEGRDDAVCPPGSWKLLPVLAEACSQVLSAWKPLSSLGLLPLLSTEEPKGRAWLALAPRSPLC